MIKVRQSVTGTFVRNIRVNIAWDNIFIPKHAVPSWRFSRGELRGFYLLIKCCLFAVIFSLNLLKWVVIKCINGNDVCSKLFLLSVPWNSVIIALCCHLMARIGSFWDLKNWHVKQKKANKQLFLLEMNNEARCLRKLRKYGCLINRFTFMGI